MAPVTSIGQMLNDHLAKAHSNRFIPSTLKGMTILLKFESYKLLLIGSCFNFYTGALDNKNYGAI